MLTFPFSKFPSLYVALQGAVTVSDECGIRGSVYLNPTVAVPADGLSTLSYRSELIIAEGVSTGVYDPAACPTYGVSDPITFIGEYVGNNLTWTTRTYRTIGPPYNPILLPPNELLSLDPEWMACTWNTAGDFASFSYGLFDPPRVLTPAVVMGNPTTTPTQIISSTVLSLTSSPTAQPAGTRFSDVPTSTLTLSESNSATPGSSAPSAISSIVSPSLRAIQTETQRSFVTSSTSMILTFSGSQSSASSMISSPGTASSYGSNPTQPAVTGLPNPAPGSSPSGTSLPGGFSTTHAVSTDSVIDPDTSQPGGRSMILPQSLSDTIIGSLSRQSLAITEGGTQVSESPRNQPMSTGLGPMILSGLGIASSTTINQQTTSQQTVPSKTVSSSSPQAPSIAGLVISQGGSSITVSGMHFSLGSAGLVIGSKTLTIKPVDSTAANTAQQTFTPVPKVSMNASENPATPSVKSSLISSGPHLSLQLLARRSQLVLQLSLFWKRRSPLVVKV